MKKILNFKKLKFILVFMFLSFLRLFILSFKFNPITDFFAYYDLSSKYIEELIFPKGPEPLFFPLLISGIKSFIINFFSYQNAYIYSARLINFLSGLGLILVLYFILIKFISEKYVFIFLTFLTLNPYFIILYSYETSDMLFLLLSFLSLYCILKRSYLSLIFVVLSSLTRFEGIIFFPWIFLIKQKKKFSYYVYVFVGTVILFFILFYFKYSGGRFFSYIEKYFTMNQFSYFEEHPFSILSLIYSNVFFFYSFKLPFFVKLFALFSFFAFVIGGMIYILKKDSVFSLAILVSTLIYLFSRLKFLSDARFPGSIHKFSFFFYILFFLFGVGVYYLTTYNNKYVKFSGYFILIILFSLSILSLYIKPKTNLIVFIILIPMLIMIILNEFSINGNKHIIRRIITIFSIISLAYPIFFSSLIVSLRYFRSGAHNALPLISRWIEIKTKKKDKILFVGYQLGLKFYYGKGFKRKVKTFPFQKSRNLEMKQLEKKICSYCRIKKIKYIIVENLPRKGASYLNFQVYVFSTKLKFLCLKLKKPLLFKGIVVAKIFSCYK